MAFTAWLCVALRLPLREQGRRIFVSTPAPLLHSASANDRGLPPALEAQPGWKAELNARLREHRERRSPGPAAADAPAAASDGQAASTSRVAARVAERYSKAPSYQDLFAASAQAAAIAADSAAHAALQAHAAAQAALSDWEEHCEQSDAANQTAQADVFADSFFTPTVSPAPVVFPATVEHHAPLPERTLVPRHVARDHESERASAGSQPGQLVDAFAEALVPAAHSLPAKLIEFPRELIAPRKQRPRLAEGPLFEQELPQESSGTALRIFEVETAAANPDSMVCGEFAAPGEAVAWHSLQESFSSAGDSNDAMVKPYKNEPESDLPRRRGSFQAGHEPAAEPASGRAGQPFARQASASRQQSGWGSIRLGEHPQPEAQDEPAQPSARRPEHGYQAETAPALHELAPISDRSMAALVDGGIVFACFLLSLLVFASCTLHPPAGKAALAVGFIVFGALATFYGWLFMSYGGGSTPGMRYARIALCSFADENPTRKDLQNRVPATALALLPLGLGVFWALLDEDKLGWHDRMTRTYQRSYR